MNAIDEVNAILDLIVEELWLIYDHVQFRLGMGS